MKRFICWSLMCFVISLCGTAAAQYAGAAVDPRLRVSAYVQHGQSGRDLDWQCGNLSYTRPGYAHQGMDLAIPWTVHGVSYPHVLVRAGVRGKVVAAYAACADVCTTGDCICANARGTGNFVHIADRFGRSRLFMHLRRNSVSVRIGDTVEADTAVGEIGSSGFSTGPHLHDEFRDGTASIEPFAGNCASNDAYSKQVSLWSRQPDYRSVPSTAPYACAVEPGKFDNGYRDDVSRRAFQNAYGFRGYGQSSAQLGCPKTPDGRSSFVHAVANVEVQDFVQDDASKRFTGSQDGHTALIRKPGAVRAYLLRTGFWGVYKCLPMNVDVRNGYTSGSMGGAVWLGAAYDNETASRQNFEHGSLTYLSDGSVRLSVVGVDVATLSALARAASLCGPRVVL